jgi:phosphate transport system permease protein
MNFDRAVRRKLFSHGMTVLSGLAIVVILVPLASVIYTAVVLGSSSLSYGFFTQPLPDPCSPHLGVSCPTGGVAPALDGTLILIGLSSLFSVPIGVAAAIFSVEYGGERAGARIIGLVADVLSGVPSIVAGVFVYTLVLYYDPAITFSTLSGSFALALLMVPIVTRTSEEALRTIPQSVREAALALGISRWKTSVRIVLVGALPGVLTGILLSIARSAGEAAPLLLTLGNGCPHPFEGINQEGCALSLWIYQGATSPDQNWIALAWGAALLLVVLVLGLSLVTRLVLDRMARRWKGSE